MLSSAAPCMSMTWSLPILPAAISFSIWVKMPSNWVGEADASPWKSKYSASVSSCSAPFRSSTAIGSAMFLPTFRT